MKKSLGLSFVVGALTLIVAHGEAKPLTEFRSGIVQDKIVSFGGDRKILDAVVFSGENIVLQVSLVLARHPEDKLPVAPIRLPSHEWWEHVRVHFVDSTGRKIPGTRPAKLIAASTSPHGAAAPSAKSPYLPEGQMIEAELSMLPPPVGDYLVSVRFMHYSDDFPLKVRIGNETPEVKAAFLKRRLRKGLSGPEEESVLRELTTLDTLNVEYAERLGRIELRKNDARAALVQFERALNSFNANSGGWTESAKKRDFGIWSELQRRHAQLSSTVTVLRQVASKPGLVVRATKSGSEEVFRFEDRSGNPLSTLRLR